MKGARTERPDAALRQAHGMFAQRPLAPQIGVEITGLDLTQPLDDETFADIEQVWLKHCVLLLRGQSLDEDAQVAFATRFGPLAQNVNRHNGASTRHPATMLISNIREDGKLIGALPDGEMLFHSDQCYVETPCAAGMLYGIEIPSYGGETIFANMYLAFDTLPDDLKNAVDGRRAINIFEYSDAAGYGASAMEMFAELPPDSKHCAHPIVCTHPVTGRRALYVNRGMTLCIEGLPRSESDALLKQIFSHQEQLRFQYAHSWRAGDLVLWDNRCTLHARNDFPANERRKLRRVTILGKNPA
jgi:taurine dioxygenase